MKDTIFLTQARFPCHIGVTEDERSSPQDVLIDIELEIDLSLAGRSDNIRDTVDYRQVWDLLNEYISRREFNLVEKLATTVADAVMFRFESVESINLRIMKEGVLASRGVGSVGVRIHRQRTNEA